MPTIEQAQQWYPVSDPVHGFDHVLRVYRLAERLAQAEGADLEIVRAAVLLHDAQPPPDGLFQAVEITEKVAPRHHHHVAGADFAGQVLASENWSADRVAAVQHCIRAHRFRDDREVPQTIEAKVLFDADKLDAIGAIGVARAVAYAARAGQPAYLEPSALFLGTGQLAPGEGHSAYHEYLFKLRKLKDRLFTASGRALAEERHHFMDEYFARLAQETRGEA